MDEGKPTWIILSVVFLTLAAISFLLSLYYQEPSLVVYDQPLGEAFRIEEVFVREKAIILLKKVQLPSDTHLAESEMLLPGRYRGVYVEIDEGKQADLKKGDRVSLLLYKAKETDFSSPKRSSPVQDNLGRKVRATFKIIE